MSDMRKLISITESYIRDAFTPTPKGFIIGDRVKHAESGQHGRVVADPEGDEYPVQYDGDDEVYYTPVDVLVPSDDESMEETAYVPGTETDPNVDWVKTPYGIKRKPGRSNHWEVMPNGAEWSIKAIDGEELMTAREYQAAMGAGKMPRFATAEVGGVLSFPAQEDAESALKAYTIALHGRGYTP